MHSIHNLLTHFVFTISIIHRLAFVGGFELFKAWFAVVVKTYSNAA